MMYHLLAFALIGLLAGVAARDFYPSQHPMRALGTLGSGMIGAVGGGLPSWATWPAVASHVRLGNLIMAFLGSVLVIVVSAGVAYATRLRT